MNITIRARKEKKTEGYMTVGTPVKIIAASLGWGGVQCGDWGIVVDRESEGHYYSVFIPRIGLCWKGTLEDIEYLSTEMVEGNSELKRLFGLGGDEEALNKTVVQLLRCQRTSKEQREEARMIISKELDEALRRHTNLMVAYDSLSYLISSAPHMYTEPSDYVKVVWMTLYLLKEMYKSISVDTNGFITATTKTIYIPYGKYKIKMGEYSITIHGNSVVVYAPEEQKRVDEFIHPHIHLNGLPCWGTWWKKGGEGVGELLIQTNYLRALKKIYQFLCSVDEPGWYKHVMLWHPDGGKMCRRCWELNEECICESRICVHCGKDIEKKDCKCIRCPQSEEIIGKEYDPYCRENCSSWSKEEEKCRG